MDMTDLGICLAPVVGEANAAMAACAARFVSPLVMRCAWRASWVK